MAVHAFMQPVIELVEPAGMHREATKPTVLQLFTFTVPADLMQPAGDGLFNGFHRLYCVIPGTSGHGWRVEC